MNRELKTPEKITLFDRIAVGFLSAVLAVMTYLFLWSIFALFSFGHILPIEIFYFFVGGMFALGFFTLDNYFIEILVSLWRFIIRVFG